MSAAGPAGPEPSGRNLLEYRAVAAVAHSRLYPGLLQWVTVLVFALILYQLMLGPDSAHDNLGTALTWVVWWPLLPIAFLLLGRFWCAVCPFGLVSDVVQRAVGVQRAVPRWLKRYGIWIIDACFILITWADHVFGIVGSPWGSGVLLLMTTTAVVASGAFLQRRAFCRYVCFLGGVAGNYARAGMLALRAKPEVCATCTSRAACFNGGTAAPACPMFEFPRTIDSNANCNLCAHCIKNCPHDAITLTLRAPTKELWFIRRPRLAESFLAVAIMGIVLIQNLTMLDVWGGMLARIEAATGTTSYAVNYGVGFAVAISVPALLLLGAARVAGRWNGESARNGFARFGYALIPLDVAAHLAHNLFHLLAEGKSVAYTAAALVGHDGAHGSAALAGLGTIRALQFTLLALGLAGSLYTAYRIQRGGAAPRRGRRATLVPYAALLVGLGILNAWLFMLPMAMRT
jgi:polyferredoxin